MGAFPGNEAHGAYAFCVLACLCMLGQPSQVIPESESRVPITARKGTDRCFRHLDLPPLISWLSARQYAPEGGLSGRTNKLVDACYSHGGGDCWPFIDAALEGVGRPPSSRTPGSPALWNQEGLVRYIMLCAQEEEGGLRDKPSKQVDSLGEAAQ